MLTFASKYADNGKFSQFGEDGIIKEILHRIKPTVKTCVEFGGHDGYFCSNTRHLINQGWEGRMYDINPQGEQGGVIRAEITPENVNEIVGNPTVLSIDCDNPDYWIWKAYTGTPAIVIIEVNSSIAPPEELVPGDRGASYISMAKLAVAKGYFVVCHTGNVIAVRNEYRKLFPEIKGDGISNWSLYFNTSHLVGK